MNKSICYAALAVFLLHSIQLFSETITASEFNQLYSCENPFRPNETSTIILDEDIIITNLVTSCLLIEAGPGFNLQTDVVNITSSDNHAFIVGTEARWIIGVNITFTGNAQLLLSTGAILQFPDFQPILRMSGNSIFRPVSVTP